MQSTTIRAVLLSAVVVLITGCSVVEGIFKAGMGVGIFIVVAILAIILFIVSKLFGKK